ncbi:putative membrane protein [Janthinobacterium agaricidamnosum NBRC 102515 = DSM 9628]|uniref:Putative membrane protein n=1 Tax=Janthinobacterium agaricidamnosum NBRC 102515 = DSM 9628 TaxID=1349767 RepID=W0V1J2_9BURK|nr:putative membrane protein [Janthinobacterium agaricidamnosum NBRC 102515 = DSM 9628]
MARDLLVGHCICVIIFIHILIIFKEIINIVEKYISQLTDNS